MYVNNENARRAKRQLRIGMSENIVFWAFDLKSNGFTRTNTIVTQVLLHK